MARVQSVKGIICIIVLIAVVVLAIIGRMDYITAALFAGLAIAELVG